MKWKLLFISLFLICFSYGQSNLQDSIFMPSTIVVKDSAIFSVNNLFVAPTDEQLISEYRVSHSKQNLFFWISFFGSIALTIVFLVNKSFVKQAFQSFFNVQFGIQQLRVDRQSSGAKYFIHLLILLCLILGFSFYLKNQFTLVRSLLLLGSSFFALLFIDLLAYSLYGFFTQSIKTVELLRKFGMNAYVILVYLMWPLLFFIFLSQDYISKPLLSLLLGLLVLFYVVKEFKLIQILFLEKSKIYSFHFFAYLCTFKFLPMIVLLGFIVGKI